MNIIISNKIPGFVFALSVVILFCAITALAEPTSLSSMDKIAFTSNRDGNLEIYIMDSRGTTQTRLTNNTVLDAHPALSPDGQKIAFLREKPSGGHAIYIMNIDGTVITEVTSVNYTNPPAFPYGYGWKITWSPDGGSLAFNDDINIFIVKTDGTDRRLLTNGVGPDWSPDGSKILFLFNASFGGSLNTIKPDGSDRRTLPPLPDFYSWYYDAAWSPKGDKIATIAFDSANEVVFTMNSDGTNAVEAIVYCLGASLGCSRISNVDWSPNGNSLVFFVLSTGQLYAQHLTSGESTQLTNSLGRNSHASWQGSVKASYDFDNDRRADVSTFRPSNSVWYIDRSSQGVSETQFGLPSDALAPGDFDGDGKTDIAIYRNGDWWRINSRNSTVTCIKFGRTGDIPIAADFSGDGLDDLAVYRGGQWWMYNTLNGQISVVSFGLTTDRPVPADYDGDGRVDQAVYRNGEWHLNRSAQGYSVVNWGLSTDKPIPADYDGDGKTDRAVYRDGTWYILQSASGWAQYSWGLATDTPAPADYDGDGKADIAVYRNGTWYLKQSTSGISIRQFGSPTDKPIPAAYLQ